jgi:16S rRNA (guanine527-N7)-methyltransferase
MIGPDTTDPLLETLRLAQRLGFFGAAPMEDAIAHARAFVSAIGPVSPGTRIVDIGSGGGLPGLVVAGALPQAEVVLIDRRQKRTDFLERAVRRLGLANTTVRCADVERIADGVASGTERGFAVVTARGFGPPERTLRWASRLLAAAGGVIVISEPPDRDRWDAAVVASLGLTSERLGPVRRFGTASPADQA